jgi:peptidoglycan/xylan/chitin deacetylase (PgdA/CDA1 family)
MTMTTMPFADSVKTGLLGSGWYANRLGHHAFPGILTLCYHGLRESTHDEDRIPFANLHVIAAIFAEQIRMVADTCHPIDLQTFCDAKAHGHALPARPVLITFDDGYRSVFELARPILLQHKIPATMFICSEPVRRQRLFWFDAVMRARGEMAFAELRDQADAQWRQAAEEDDTPADAMPQIAPMTEAQVRQLAADGFTIGVHTASHARLARSPVDVQRHELASCRATLEAWTGRPVTSVAYPFGAPHRDYNQETLAIAESLGFAAGFTTHGAFARPSEPALERSRFVVLAAVTAAELAHRIAYAWPR